MMRKFISYSIVVITFLILGGVGLGYWLLVDLPSVDELPEKLHRPSLRITDRYGRLLYEVLPEEGGRHVYVPLAAIPTQLQQATIATEDRGYYHHHGVDIWGTMRAAWINLRGGSTLAGGSTITQQVARNLLLEPSERTQRTIKRKLREAYLAWQLTRKYSKDEILALYLNQTYYGGLAYGVEAAAQTFFGKPVQELDLAECALIAGLPQAPALYNPYSDLHAAKKRQEVVLALMEESGYITHQQRMMAQNEPLNLAEQPYPIQAPHFVMMVRNEVDKLFPPEKIAESAGLVVRTTLDLDWQKQAEVAIREQLNALKNNPQGIDHNLNNAALVALDTLNGDVLALVGSADYFDTEIAGAINMAIAPRQPGSALKPVLYAAALDPLRPGGAWTAATMILDVRTAFTTQDGDAYIPENYDRLEHGPVLLRQALASSLNIPAVITLDHIGLDALFALAGKMGITTLGDPHRYDLSLALGGGEVRLIELTAVYAAFANGGFRITPRVILEVEDSSGKGLYKASSPPEIRILDERVAWLISDILSDDDARRLGFGENSVLKLDRPAAVKTGTTSNFHDNWTIGYTPQVVVGVWSGNSDYKPMREVNGLTGAAPIWHHFMRAVLGNRPAEEFSRPVDMVQVEVCALSGMLPSDACPYLRWEWFIPGTQPIEEDTLYRWVELDLRTGGMADDNTPAEYRQRQVVLDLPPQAHGWARSQGLFLYQDIISAHLNRSGESSRLFLIFPAHGSRYVYNPSLDASQQQIKLEAAGEGDLEEVTFWVDGVSIALDSFPPFQTWWPLSPGEHQIWVEGRTALGELLRSPVVVIYVEGDN